MDRLPTITLLFALALALDSSTLQAQSPTPMILQAASPAAVPVVSAVPEDSVQMQARIKTLEEIRTNNQEILKKQKATLEQLEEIQKAAEQLKTYSKRG